MADLTPKQERFAQKFIETGNASEAYRQAYDTENMASETVTNEAYKLQQNPHIATRIVQLETLALKRHQVTVDRVVAEYARVAFLDIRRAFDEDGRLKDIHTIDDDTAAALASIEVEELYEGRGADREHVGRLHKVKLIDKKGALDSLAKYLGMFTDGPSLTVNNQTLEKADIELLKNYAGAPERPKGS